MDLETAKRLRRTACPSRSILTTFLWSLIPHACVPCEHGLCTKCGWWVS